MTENKTQKTKVNADKFVNSLKDERRREECKILLELFRRITKDEPAMWGDCIIGFRDFRYKTKSGREANWFSVGFSPRKSYLSLYVIPYVGEIEELMKKLGKAKIGKCCINVNKLEDIDLKILEKLLKLSMKAIERGHMQN